MKLIKLNQVKGKQGYQTQVDDEDYEILTKDKWQVHINRDNVPYVRKTVYRYENGKRKSITIAMHRCILGIYDKDIKVDHKDGDPLNNQRSNLRIANTSQNRTNSSKRIIGTSIYKGVRKLSSCRPKQWMALCQKDKVRYTKCHKTEIEAALWYNQKATELHGEFARLNVIKL